MLAPRLLHYFFFHEHYLMRSNNLLNTDYGSHSLVGYTFGFRRYRQTHTLRNGRYLLLKMDSPGNRRPFPGPIRSAREGAASNRPARHSRGGGAPGHPAAASGVEVVFLNYCFINCESLSLRRNTRHPNGIYWRAFLKSGKFIVSSVQQVPLCLGIGESMLGDKAFPEAQETT